MAIRMNVGSGERWLRVIFGIVMIAVGLLYFKVTIIGYLVALSGGTLLATGLFRWCPMCYVGGRRLPEKQ